MVKRIFKITTLCLLLCIIILLLLPKPPYQNEVISGWTLDPVYSGNLSISSAKLYDPIYGQAPFSDSYKTVDHIRIYKGIYSRKEALTLAAILSKERLFESKDKEVIKRIILAAQDGMQHSNCGRTSPDPRKMIYVVGFNSTTKQAGYFVVSQCYSEKSIGVIRGFQGHLESSAIYYSSAIIKVMQELDILP